jgi:uncharacterized membrane protein YidH (DUF202 family)
MGWGFEESTWNGVDAAIYMGAGTPMESVWLWLSVALCVIAVVLGSKHEKDAYKKMEK